MLKLYVGCALTEAPPDFRESIEELKEVLSKDYEVLKFLGLVAGTPGDVFQQDIIENVGTCHFMLAVCDYPSTGLGTEIAVAAMGRRAPVLAVAHDSKKITRIVTGMSEFYPNLKVAAYGNLLEDVPKLVHSFANDTKDDMWDHQHGVPLWTLDPQTRRRITR